MFAWGHRKQPCHWTTGEEASLVRGCIALLTPKQTSSVLDKGQLWPCHGPAPLPPPRGGLPAAAGPPWHRAQPELHRGRAEGARWAPGPALTKQGSPAGSIARKPQCVRSGVFASGGAGLAARPAPGSPPRPPAREGCPATGDTSRSRGAGGGGVSLGYGRGRACPWSFWSDGFSGGAFCS